MAQKKFYAVNELQPLNTAGAWTMTHAANLTSLNKTANADTSTLVFPIPRNIRPGGTGEPQIVSIAAQWDNATAALSSAPTVTVNKVSINDTTKAVTRAALANTLTIAGTDAVGTATGDFTAKAALNQPYTLLDNEALTFEITFAAAATSVVKVYGLQVEFA